MKRKGEERGREGEGGDKEGRAKIESMHVGSIQCCCSGTW
jgi:hypothetical protein